MCVCGWGGGGGRGVRGTSHSFACGEYYSSRAAVLSPHCSK